MMNEACTDAFVAIVHHLFIWLLHFYLCTSESMIPKLLNMSVDPRTSSGHSLFKEILSWYRFDYNVQPTSGPCHASRIVTGMHLSSQIFSIVCLVLYARGSFTLQARGGQILNLWFSVLVWPGSTALDRPRPEAVASEGQKWVLPGNSVACYLAC